MPATTPTASILAACGLAACLPAGLARAQADPLGEPFPAVLELADLDGQKGFVIEGATAGDRAGSSVSGRTLAASTGDVNGDGVDDVVIGARRVDLGARVDSGAAYVIFGRPGGFPAILPLALLEPATGLRIVSDSDRSADEELGTSVAMLGDVNGDGLADVAAGAPFTWRGDPSEGPYFYGRSYVVFGRTEPAAGDVIVDDLDGTNGLAIEGDCLDDQLGATLSAAGDISGDGVEDIAVGSLGGTVADCTGDATVVFGRGPVGVFPPIVSSSSLSGSNGFVFRTFSGYYGGIDAIAGLGDVNGDGIGDLAAGSKGEYTTGSGYGYEEGTGATFIIFGRAAATEPFPRSFDRTVLDGATGVVLAGGGLRVQSGAGVAGVGDLNGDGLADLAVGEPGGESPDADRTRGRVHIVFGRLDWPAQLNLSDGAVPGGVTIVGAREGDRIGASVAGVGDLDGDGLDDLALLAEGVANGGAYVLFGRGDGWPDRIDLGALAPHEGMAIRAPSRITSLSPAGDVNHDGRPDLILGTPLDGSGMAYVIYGRGPAACEADLDGDGELTIFDFLAFQNLFDLMDPRADFDGDGSLTLFDFLAFQNAFSAGCP